MLLLLSISIAGLLPLALSQGSIGGSQGVCPSFQQLGCALNGDNGAHAGFTWLLTSDPLSPQSYPGYSGPLVPQTCEQACRGHGFAFAGLYNQTQCYCSSSFPNTVAQPNSNAAANPNGGSSPGTLVGMSACTVGSGGCSGNKAEACGSATGTVIYWDQTVQNSTADRQPANYGYVGCFTSLDDEPLYALTQASSTVNCASYCGKLGYSFMGRSGPDSSDARTCGCGTEIQVGVEVSESYCNTFCNGTQGAQ